MNEEIWFLENQFPRLVMDNDRHGFWLLPKEPTIGPVIDEEQFCNMRGDECFFCKKPSTGDWLVGIEVVCVECFDIWEYDSDTESYINITKYDTDIDTDSDTEEEKDWEICKSCCIKTKRNWYRSTTNCTCPGDADIDDCECDWIEEGIFCGDCGEYCKYGFDQVHLK